MIRARCEVLSARKAGLFISVTLVAPEIAERARIPIERMVAIS